MGLKDRIFYYLTRRSMPYQVKPGQDSKFVDPVCHMKVDPKSPYKTNYEGTSYLFCARKCLDKFKSEPARYVRGLKKAV